MSAISTRRLVAVLAACSCLLASQALLEASPAASIASTPPVAWPLPLDGADASRFDFVHVGENHHNEHGGPVVNGEIFRQTNLYEAAFFATSADMATTGNLAELGSFKDYITRGFSPVCPASRNVTPCQTPIAVPWFHSMGNHDRGPLAGPGGVASYTNGVFRDLFADQNGPFGDGPVPAGFSGSAADGPGASTHYWVDHGSVRLIVLDNSCHSFTTCDAFTLEEQACLAAGQVACPRIGQQPPVGPGYEHVSQLAFLAEAAAEATAAGKLVFVMMHQPSRDPRFPLNVDPISVNHTMNKGATDDNAALEAIAVATGVDGLLFGHIKGNNIYDALGVPAYIDGGGGGRPYALDTWTVDFGAYYGYRLFRIDGAAIEGTWLVPILKSIAITSNGAPVGSITAPVGTTIDLDAIGESPRCTTTQFSACSNQNIPVELRPPAPPAGFETSVPAPAYVWHTSDPSILAPLGTRDEAGFDAATMSAEGSFTATSPGTVIVTVAAGWTTRTVTVTVV
jgi:hypothetical protein